MISVLFFVVGIIICIVIVGNVVSCVFNDICDSIYIMSINRNNKKSDKEAAKYLRSMHC